MNWVFGVQHGIKRYREGEIGFDYFGNRLRIPKEIARQILDNEEILQLSDQRVKLDRLFKMDQGSDRAGIKPIAPILKHKDPPPLLGINGGGFTSCRVMNYLTAATNEKSNFSCLQALLKGRPIFRVPT